jgi:dihydrofolate reductase
MRKVILYSALSLDGFIARKDGNIDWLHDDSMALEGEDYGYGELMDSIDSTLMGANTFRQVISFDMPFPYEDKKNYVFSRKRNWQHPHATIVQEDPVDFVKRLKKEEGKDIWLIGGGQINALLHKHKLIDEYQLTYLPIILGDGIQLLAGAVPTLKLHLREGRTYANGMLFKTYVHA